MEVLATTGAIRHAKRQVKLFPPTNSFLQVGCPSCHPTNSIKAPKGGREWNVLIYEMY